MTPPPPPVPARPPIPAARPVAFWLGCWLALWLAPAARAEPLPLLRLETGVHGAPITSLTVDGAGRLLSCARDGTARLWALPGGALQRTLRLPAAWPAPLRCALSPDGRTLSVENDDLHAREVDLATGAVREVEGKVRGMSPTGTGFADYPIPWKAPDFHWSTDGTAVFDMDRAADGRLLRSSGQLLCLYDRALRHLAHVELPAGARPGGVRFSPDGHRVAVGFLGAPRIEIRSGDDLRLLATPDVSGAGGDLRVVAFSSDGRLYAGGDFAAGGGHPLRRWERGGEGPFVDLPGPDLRAEVTALVPLPGGRLAFASADPAWGVLGPDGGRQAFVGPLRPRPGPDGLRVSPDGARVQLAAGPRFSVPGRTLARAEADLAAPRLDDPRMPLLDWREGERLILQGMPLSVPQGAGRAHAVAIAEDGRSFLVGTDRLLLPTDPDKLARLREGASLVQVLSGYAVGLPSPALSVAYADGGRRYVAALADGTVRWYGAAERREALGLLLHPDGRWLLFTPGGFYDASPGAEDLLGWHVDRPGYVSDFFPASRFRKSYLRPDVVDLALGGGGAPGPAGAGPRGAALPPVVTILSPQDGAAPGPELRLRVGLRAPGAPVTGLRVLLDGRPAKALAPAATPASPPAPKDRGVVSLGSEAPAAATPAAPFGEQRDLTVPLRGGESTVAVLADSAAGPSAPAILRLGGAEAPRELRPKLYVLAVGVGAYASKELRLRYPAKDAKDLSAALKAQAGRLYRDVEARVLTDGGARQGDVLAGLQWLQRSATDLDTSVLFFAGHGIDDPGSGQYYFVPQDGDLREPLRTMVADVQLREVLASLPGRVVLLLDTCHAGKVLPGRGLRGAGAGLSRLVGELASAEGGVVVLAAATARQAAQEDAKWRNGAFTKALVEGLGGKAAYGGAGRVTLDMLALYVSERVKALTGGTQTPAVAKPGTIPDFPVAAPAR